MEWLAMACLYTVYRCRSLESTERRGPMHYSDDAEKTLCGKTIDHHWYVDNNTFTGVATCRVCVRIDADTIAPQRTNNEISTKETENLP